MAIKISLIIDSVCKELGINYISCNPHLVTAQEDAIKLKKIYLQLKQISEIIKEIETRHDLGELKEQFELLIKNIDNADTDIIRLAKELTNKNE